MNGRSAFLRLIAGDKSINVLYFIFTTSVLIRCMAGKAWLTRERFT